MTSPANSTTQFKNILLEMGFPQATVDFLREQGLKSVSSMLEVPPEAVSDMVKHFEGVEEVDEAEQAKQKMMEELAQELKEGLSDEDGWMDSWGLRQRTT